MTLVPSPRYLRILLLLPWAMLAVAAAAPQSFATLGRSAQVVMQGERTANGLAVRFARPDGAALAVSAVSASVDGRHLNGTREADGSWGFGPLPAGDGRLEVIVDHDGIRELLSGSLPGSSAAAAAAPAGMARDHKQLLWWILNIGIVLIAVLAVSRRMS